MWLKSRADVVREWTGSSTVPPIDERPVSEDHFVPVAGREARNRSDVAPYWTFLLDHLTECYHLTVTNTHILSKTMLCRLQSVHKNEGKYVRVNETGLFYK